MASELVLSFPSVTWCPGTQLMVIGIPLLRSLLHPCLTLLTRGMALLVFDSSLTAPPKTGFVFRFLPPSAAARRSSPIGGGGVGVSSEICEMRKG